MELVNYGPHFKRARIDAASRLARDEFLERKPAARAIGISESMLKQLETGGKRPSFETLEKMARAYNVEVGDLLPSSAPRGPEVDRIIAPLAALRNATRGRFIVQMEAFARMLAAEMNRAHDGVMVAIRDEDHETISVIPPYTSQPVNSGLTDALKNSAADEAGDGASASREPNATTAAGNRAAGSTARARKSKR